MARVLSFVWPYCHFSNVFGLKRTRTEISQNIVNFSARELRSEIISSIFEWCRYQNNPRLSWSLIHGNLDVTSMLVFCRTSSTKLRQNYNITLTKLRQNMVDENPKLSKPHPGVYFAKFGFPSTKLWRSCVKVML